MTVKQIDDYFNVELDCPADITTLRASMIVVLCWVYSIDGAPIPEAVFLTACWLAVTSWSVDADIWFLTNHPDLLNALPHCCCSFLLHLPEQQTTHEAIPCFIMHQTETAPKETCTFFSIYSVGTWPFFHKYNNQCIYIANSFWCSTQKIISP